MVDSMKISDREELIYLLSEASELEHGLCCCYLFAAFSLKRTADEGLTEPEQLALARWERVISGVAAQEMLHLALVSNLLTALGASPHFRRPNFPQRSKYYPPSLQLTLRPLDEKTLDHFIFIERPEGLDFPDGAGFEALPTPPSTSSTNGIEPIEVPYSTIGQLYRDIEDGFKALTTRYGEERVFIGPPRAQATSSLLPFPGLSPVTDLASALHAIELIVEQGEGLRGDIENSHYARFLAIRGELDRLRAGRPDFEPARPVMENPFTEPPADCAGYNLIDHPQARAVSELFNACYGLMLEILMRFFAHTEESHAELKTLIDTAIGIMEGVIKPLGTILTSLPATSNADVPRAGPSFDFYRSINYLPHRDSAWALFAERFEELAEFSGKLADLDEARIGLDTVHASIQALSAALGQHMRIPRSLTVTHV
jgi:hypothetical protein